MPEWKPCRGASAVPSGLVIAVVNPGVETPGYFHLSLPGRFGNFVHHFWHRFGRIVFLMGLSKIFSLWWLPKIQSTLYGRAPVPGVRPSPVAAMSARTGVSEFSIAARPLHVAAPEDGGALRRRDELRHDLQTFRSAGRSRSATVPGRSNVRTHGSSEFSIAARPLHVAAPEDGRTPTTP